MKKILLGAVLAAVVVFAWGAVARMATPLGHMGIKKMESEGAVLSATQHTIDDPGFYFFPGIDRDRKLSDAEEEAWNAKYEAGPRGILIYEPKGGKAMSPTQLLTQFVINFAAGLVAAILLSMTSVTFPKRVLFVTLLGVFSWLVLSLPYWNWYFFPMTFVLAEGIMQTVGWLLGGIVLAAVVKPAKASGAS
ncbi:MAG: hypothetical protein O7H41_20155 [Planctomycetota bacterium]|nr:hypothetical protein [Planctomycetota bacterium]